MEVWPGPYCCTAKDMWGEGDKYTHGRCRTCRIFNVLGSRDLHSKLTLRSVGDMTVMEPFVDVSYFHHARWDEKQGAENVSQRSMCLRELNSRPPGPSETVSGSWSWGGRVAGEDEGSGKDHQFLVGVVGRQLCMIGCLDTNFTPPSKQTASSFESSICSAASLPRSEPRRGIKK